MLSHHFNFLFFSINGFVYVFIYLHVFYHLSHINHLFVLLHRNLLVLSSNLSSDCWLLRIPTSEDMLTLKSKAIVDDCDDDGNKLDGLFVIEEPSDEKSISLIDSGE